MKPGFNLQARIASAALAATLVAGGCAMMVSKADHYVPPPVGSTWVSAERTTGSYGSGSKEVTTTRGERMWHGQQVITYETPQSSLLSRPDGHWIGIFKGDVPLITWDPPLTWDWPLEVGKTWTYSYRMTMHAAKRTIPYQVTQKVEAYEDVTVPAGTFKAFKLSASTTLGEENTVWFSPELGIFVKHTYRRLANNAQGPGTRDVELVSQTIRR